ncbi:MAG TPA: NAD-dependent epimerase/dehydratase family protein [Candidatus Paceibacterota bacterium]
MTENQNSKTNFYNGKNTLVTGGTGLIGRPLVEMLIDAGAKVRIASLDDSSRAHPQAEFMQVDLTDKNNCMKAAEGMDMVFHLAGIKGSPKMTQEKPASFFVPTILFNTNMMEAARKSEVERYLFTSTVGVYSPAEIFSEDDVWKTFPSENDKFAGWAKRMGELQVEAYAIEYGWDKVAIVRPANVYGPYDNFDPANAMVIPSLVKRALDGENPLVVWGDGSPVRDFIHAKDVAKGMLLALEKCPGYPINLGSGEGVQIKEIVEIIVNNMERKPKVEWDTSKPSGDKKRLMDISRARALGWKPEVSIEEGIKEVMQWYKENKDIVEKRYNVFK